MTLTKENITTIGEIDKVPGLRQILDQCQKDIMELTGIPVTVSYKLKFHHLSTSSLIQIICEVCEVSWVNVMSKNRKISLVVARHLFIYFSLLYQKKTLTTIADFLQYKDHTTVIHARDKVQNMIDSHDDLYMPLIIEIKTRIDNLLIPKNEAQIEHK